MTTFKLEDELNFIHAILNAYLPLTQLFDTWHDLSSLS